MPFFGDNNARAVIATRNPSDPQDEWFIRLPFTGAAARVALASLQAEHETVLLCPIVKSGVFFLPLVPEEKLRAVDGLGVGVVSPAQALNLTLDGTRTIAAGVINEARSTLIDWAVADGAKQWVSLEWTRLLEFGATAPDGLYYPPLQKYHTLAPQWLIDSVIARVYETEQGTTCLEEKTSFDACFDRRPEFQPGDAPRMANDHVACMIAVESKVKLLDGAVLVHPTQQVRPKEGWSFKQLCQLCANWQLHLYLYQTRSAATNLRFIAASGLALTVVTQDDDDPFNSETVLDAPPTEPPGEAEPTEVIVRSTTSARRGRPGVTSLTRWRWNDRSNEKVDRSRWRACETRAPGAAKKEQESIMLARLDKLVRQGTPGFVQLSAEEVAEPGAVRAATLRAHREAEVAYKGGSALPLYSVYQLNSMAADGSSRLAHSVSSMQLWDDLVAFAPPELRLQRKTLLTEGKMHGQLGAGASQIHLIVKRAAVTAGGRIHVVPASVDLGDKIRIPVITGGSRRVVVYELSGLPALLARYPPLEYEDTICPLREDPLTRCYVVVPLKKVALRSLTQYPGRMSLTFEVVAFARRHGAPAPMRSAYDKWAPKEGEGEPEEVRDGSEHARRVLLAGLVTAEELASRIAASVEPDYAAYIDKVAEESAAAVARAKALLEAAPPAASTRVPRDPKQRQRAEHGPELQLAAGVASAAGRAAGRAKRARPPKGEGGAIG